MSAEPVREHVRLLRSAGASWQTIANTAGIGAMTVFDVMHRSSRVSDATAAALLAVQPGDMALPRVNANGAMLRLRSLQAMGHSSARIARSIGCHEQTLQRVANGSAQTIRADLHRAIVAVFTAWWDKRPPENTPAEKAAAGHSMKRCSTCLPTGLEQSTARHPVPASQLNPGTTTRRQPYEPRQANPTFDGRRRCGREGSINDDHQ
jgi:hypothetical protein